MLQIKNITRKMNDFNLIKNLYKTSFPKKEREPLSSLLRRVKKGAKFEAYYDGGLFVGLSSVQTIGDLSYVQYLAVEPSYHSKGYGSQILTHIRESNKGKRIILNIEMENENAKNLEQRKKRREFYLRNGYETSNLIVIISGNKLELLIYGGTCTKEEVIDYFRNYFGYFLFKIILRLKIFRMEEEN